VVYPSHPAHQFLALVDEIQQGGVHAVHTLRAGSSQLLDGLLQEDCEDLVVEEVAGG
jgi:hypothetical protein